MKIDLILHDLDRELRKDFKTACAHYGLSMKAVLVKHMENIINDYRVAKIDSRKPKSYSNKKGKL